jgi:hypothetical protein
MFVSVQLHAPIALMPGETVPGIHRIGASVGPKVSLHVVVKKKSLPCPCRKSNPDRPSRSIVTIVTELLQLWTFFDIKLNGLTSPETGCTVLQSLELSN